MAYLTLSKMGYEALIKAAANKAGSVAKVCTEQGIWGGEAILEAPAGVAQEEVDAAMSEVAEEIIANVFPDPEPKPKFEA